jgi:acetyl-CoA C-acetyltransferase
MRDGLTSDGLTDVYNKFHMGNCGENTARKLDISREQQDEYGMESYRRAARAYSEGAIGAEIVPVSSPWSARLAPCTDGQVEVKGKRGKPSVMVTEDEEFRKVNFDKFAKLPTVFQVL